MARTASDTEAYPVMMMKGTSIPSLSASIRAAICRPPAEDGHRKRTRSKGSFFRSRLAPGSSIVGHCFIAGFLKPFLLLSGQQDIVFNYEYSVFHPYSSLSQVFLISESRFFASPTSRSILPMTVSVYVLMVRSSEVSSCRILLYVSSSQATPSCSQVGYMRCRVFFIRSVSVFMLSRAFFQFRPVVDRFLNESIEHPFHIPRLCG